MTDGRSGCCWRRCVSCAAQAESQAECSAQATPHRSLARIADAAPFTIRPTPSLARPSTLIITQLPSTTKRHSSEQSDSPSSSSSPPTLNCCHSAIASPTLNTASPPLPDLSNYDRQPFIDHTRSHSAPYNAQQLSYHRDHHRQTYSNRRHAFQQHLQRLLHLFPRTFRRARGDYADLRQEPLRRQ
jgi:hypothetical protein